MNSTIDRLRLARTPGVGPIVYRRLLQRFGTAAEAIAALPDIARRAGRSTPPKVPNAAAAEREIEAVGHFGAQLIFLGDPAYPKLLALMDDAPAVIAVQGQVEALQSRAVALVGSRNASVNGMKFASQLAAELAAVGIVVVSGMARGIDQAAHKAALHAGLTVACVAGGLDRPYPPEHAGLQSEIASHGCVVAEAPLGALPIAQHFPRRNRIIAGLSLGVVVVEAALRSGSLITARLALENGRELFAVPGSPLDPRCRGTNGLLRDGAHVTESAADIFANLPDHPKREGLGRDPLFARPADELPGLSEHTVAYKTPEGGIAEVLALLSPAPTLVDDLLRRCQLSASEVRAVLLDLELAGRVETLAGNRVALIAGPD